MCVLDYKSKINVLIYVYVSLFWLISKPTGRRVINDETKRILKSLIPGHGLSKSDHPFKCENIQIGKFVLFTILV